MKKFIWIAAIFLHSTAFAQIHLQGEVVNTEGNPLPHSNVVLLNSKVKTQTGKRGNFNMICPLKSDTLTVTHTGYVTYKQNVTQNSILPLRIVLQPQIQSLEEVTISTGYYSLPKERATGSFSQLDTKTLNRTVSPDILSRLEGMASGLQFNRQQVTGENKKTPTLRIRGLATIESDETPLIVLDNFPYEGDINNINPNDVESVTVLKDAAAASIWGARAGNGVIVITTKKGRYNQKTNIGFHTNFTVGNKPDLFYNRRFLSSEAVLEIEQERFLRNGFTQDPLTVLPDFVETLFSYKNDLQNAALLAQKKLLSGYDVRKEASKYLYQNSLNRQYALSLNGGGERYRYFVSGGYDRIRENVIGNNSQRLSLNLQNSFNVSTNLELMLGLKYTDQNFNGNGLNLQQLNPEGQLVSTYQRIADAQGMPLSIPYRMRTAYVSNTGRSDLLDWNFKPLEEQKLANATSHANEVLLNTELKYRFLQGFNAVFSYQFLQSKADGQSYFSPDSYYTRNLVNKFTQSNGQRIIPYNGILQGQGASRGTSHSGRMQLNYNKQFNDRHELNALAGGEIRSQVLNGFPGYTLYNYNEDLFTGTTYFDYTRSYPVLPAGNLNIPAPTASLSRLTDRYLSYFGNFSYTYASRYTLSGSSRWDGSNLFGVKTNQKGVPLWSAGASWDISKEAFYHLKFLPYQRFRLTYGSSGNVNKQVSAYPTVNFNTFQQLPIAQVTSIGNPGLRWEKIKTLNAGWDFGFSGNRIKGSIEYYRKKSTDLIGIDYMAPSTGITNGVGNLQNKINYATMKSTGIDVQLSVQILRGALNWESTLLASYVRNSITHFNSNQNLTALSYFAPLAPPAVGQSRDVVYALPWQGLNPLNGKPVVIMNGAEGADYQAYINGLQKTDLVMAGVSVAPYYGSFRNTFSFKNFELNALFTWKAGYVFRRSSISPGQEYQSSMNYHTDLLRRWKNTGDERVTQVPAAGEYNIYQSHVYEYSKALITKGDYIRLQDVNVSYTLDQKFVEKLNIRNLRLFLNCTNVGILWRANKQGIDPEYPEASYPQVRTIAFGIQMNIQ